MQTGLTPLELADIVLLATGGLLILLGTGVLAWQSRWGEVWRLPDPPGHRLQAVDLLVALLALWALPVALLEALGGSPAASQLAAPDAGVPLPTPQQLYAHAGGQLGAAAVLLYLGVLRIRGGLRGWGLGTSLLPKHLLLAVVTYVAIWPVCAGLLYLTRALILWAYPDYTLPAHETIRTLCAEEVPGLVKTVLVLSALVLAPFVEELLFRGLLQPALARWLRSPWWGVLLSAGAFGVFHHPVSDTILTLTFFGVVLGYAYARTRSLILVILLHAVFNGKTILWIFLSR
ncbi:MAG: CPBP family intramembrane glutamic endopeptidase [Dehalococcoidia bacterium]